MSLNDNVELVKKALELKTELARVEDREALIEAKSALVDLKEELIELREQKQELSRKLAQKAQLYYNQNLYWQHDPQDPGPFCPRCWEVDSRQVHMVNWGTFTFKCNECSRVIRTREG